MAISHYGVNATLAAASPPQKVKSKDRHGRLRVSYDEYEASALAAGSQIALGWVPLGARLIGGVLAFDALGAGTQLTVGDLFDCDRFMATLGTTSANACGVFDIIGPVNLTAALGLHGTGRGYEFQCDTDILVTVPYASSAATGTIKLAVYYSTD